MASIRTRKKERKTNLVKFSDSKILFLCTQFVLFLSFPKIVSSFPKIVSSFLSGKLGLGDKSSEASETTTLGEPADQSDPEQQRGGQVVRDDETDAVTYSYTFFHVTMIFASLYIMMTVTNWYK